MKKPVRLGLVGLHFGCTVCRELMGDLNLPVRLTKVCDLDPARAEAASAEFNVPVSPSLDDLLEDLGIQANPLEKEPINLSEDEKQLLSHVRRGGESSVDQLCKAMKKSPPFVNGLLTVLEMKGIIRTSMGKIYVAK